MSPGVIVLGPGEVDAALAPHAAVDAITDALQGGLEPSEDVPRSAVAVSGGQLLVMPAARDGLGVGAKLVTAAPANAARGLPRIQGIYVAFDMKTLQVRAVIDGAALTQLRTPAVSLAALRPVLDRMNDPVNVVVFGAGPQGRGHVRALRDVGIQIASVSYVVRRPDLVRPGDLDGSVVATDRARPAVQAADIIVCATTSPVPVLDSADVADTAVLMLVGSHTPAAREVDTALVRRSHVVVENPDTALREAGELAAALADGVSIADRLIPMVDVVRGDTTVRQDRPILFKGTGMAWEDLVVAEALLRAHRG